MSIRIAWNGSPRALGCHRLVVGGLSVLGHCNFGSSLLQEERDQPLIVGPVLGQEDAAAEGQGRIGIRRCGHRGVRGGDRVAVDKFHALQIARFDAHAERASLAGFAADGNIASQHLHQPLADRQAQSRPARPACCG